MGKTGNRLVELFPVKYIDAEGNETRYDNILQAANGVWGDAFKIMSHIRMHVVEDDGGKWEWMSIDRDRLERIQEIQTELNYDLAELKYILGESNTRTPVTFKENPEDITDILYFDKTWEKNRWWQPRIQALKKTYYRPILMIDAKTKEVIKEYPSVRQCCMETGLRKGDISLILSRKRRLRSIHGYTFEYKLAKDRQRRDRELREWKRGKRKPWKMKEQK